MGIVYRRTKELPDGTRKEVGPYWLKYYPVPGGSPVYESSKTAKRSEALRLLRIREGDAERGVLPVRNIQKTTIEELAALYIRDFENNDKGIRSAKYLSDVVLSFFRGPVSQITSVTIDEFVARCKTQKYANASINRFLSALKRMFTLGSMQTPPLVGQVPKIRMLEENNIRQGFFEEDEFLAIRGVLPDHVKVVVTLAYWGMRSGEILGLQWRNVDFNAGMIRLDPGSTKNGEGRTIPMFGDLRLVLETWWAKTKTTYPDCQTVVHFRGKPVKSIKTAWKKACTKVGLEGRLLHDFRRTAVRNLSRTPGVSEHLAMMITGHKTRSVFDRYDIVDESDLQKVADLMQQSRRVTIPVTQTSQSEMSPSDSIT